MFPNRNVERNRRGSALLIVMIVVMVSAITAGAFFNYSMNMVHQVRMRADSIQARAIAEAGLNEAAARLRSQYSLRNDAGNFPETDFAGGQYSVSISTDGRATTISSEGRYKTATTTARMSLRDDSPPYLDYAIFSNGDLRFNGRPVVVGDLHSNGSFTANGGTDGITGDVTSVATGAEPVPFPALSDPDFQALIAEAAARGELDRRFGNQVFTDEELSGFIIIEGDLEFRGSANRTIDGILYVTGSITANGQGELNMTGSLLAYGKIEFNGAAGVFDYRYAGGDADQRAEVNMYGIW
jgi:hypothetical protein